MPSSSVRREMRARAATLASLVLGLTASASAGPSQYPESVLRAHFASALGVELGAVLDARGFDLHRAGDVRGFILGRYRARGAPASEFPALVVYRPCRAGTCVVAVRLDSPAKRFVAVSLVDLDATETVLAAPGLERLRFLRSVPQPEHPARWPALAIALEREHRDDESRIDFALVSLRDHATLAE